MAGAILAGWEFAQGIEGEEGHADKARRRCTYWSAQPRLLDTPAAAPASAPTQAAALDLFADTPPEGNPK